MLKDKLILSETGSLILKDAVRKAKDDLKKYNGKMRTTFFFYDRAKRQVHFIELREYIDEVIKEFNMKFPFDNKESDYSLIVNVKFFDVLSMRLHRMHPDHYMVFTQKDDGKAVSIIRDSEKYPSSNVKVTWNDLKLNEGYVQEVEFHLTRSQLQ